LGFARTTATQTVRFEAPSRLSYEFELPGGKRAIALFYAVPVARGRSRVLVRRGRDFNTEAKMTRAALVAKHLENNVVFDQDLAFLRGQEERLQAYKADGHGGAWRDEYVVPSSADRFVVNYRKKLDAVWKSTTGLGGPHQTSELSISVKSKSIRLILGRIDCSCQVLEAQRKSLVQTVRLRAH
jgi:hypothetical protein